MSDNSAQSEIWNGNVGQRWAQEQELLDVMLEPLGLAGIERAGLQAGERVLDIGCGCGATSLAIGDAVGSTGTVTGVDISEPMVARARERAAAHANLSFQVTDASQHAFAPDSVDMVFSRFGVMFFSDPAAAFANIRTSLTASGRLCNVVWRPVRENPWVLKSLMLAAEYVEMPAPAGPEDPGPFSFGDADRVNRILSDAGFKQIDLQPVDTKITIGKGLGLKDAVTFLFGIGPLSMILAEQDQATRDKVHDVVTKAVEPDFGDGGLQMDAATWVVTAKNG